MKIKHFKKAYVLLASRLLVLSNPSENDYLIACADVTNSLSDILVKDDDIIEYCNKSSNDLIKTCNTTASYLVAVVAKLEVKDTAVSLGWPPMIDVHKSMLIKLNGSPLKDELFAEWFEDFNFDDMLEVMF